MVHVFRLCVGGIVLIKAGLVKESCYLRNFYEQQQKEKHA